MKIRPVGAKLFPCGPSDGQPLRKLHVFLTVHHELTIYYNYQLYALIIIYS